jgi:3',5'-cyclic AMP phosphodiesterase CpdA
LRIIHLSDIHVWRYVFNPLRLLNKRVVGMAELILQRARRFELERLPRVVDRILKLGPDHILITGDVTTTALNREFRAAREALAPLLTDPARVTMIPGNHDRYTRRAMRDHLFEHWFGAFAPPGPYPWLRDLGPEAVILGLDPTRAHLSATGFLPPDQLAQARARLAGASVAGRRLIVACHYPLAAPAPYGRELAHKRLVNAPAVAAWLAGVGPHLYCCGHVHAAWSFSPPELPNQLCLNAGAPLLRDRTGRRPPGFLEVVLKGEEILVTHHAWIGNGWIRRSV